MNMHGMFAFGSAAIAAAFGLSLSIVKGFAVLADATELPSISMEGQNIAIVTLSTVISWLLLKQMPAMEKARAEDAAANRQCLREQSEAFERSNDKLVSELRAQGQQQFRLMEQALSCPTTKHKPGE